MSSYNMVIGVVATRDCNAAYNTWRLCISPSPRPVRSPPAPSCNDPNLFALPHASCLEPCTASIVIFIFKNATAQEGSNKT